MKSVKQKQLESNISCLVSGKALELFEMLLDDPEVQVLQEYSNVVSLSRMHFNDHGPVHMRIAARNALVIASILNAAKVPFNLESEGHCDFTDVQMALLLGAMFHDVGMTIGRAEHERLGGMIAQPIIDRLLKEVYPNDLRRRIAIRSVALESIIGHMATHPVTTLEAGVVLIADGCDMKKGRARIPMILNTDPRPGDIHQYSASAIEELFIESGKQRPLRITILMESSVGFFQVEKVLFPKIQHSTVKQHIELYAGMSDKDLKCYL